MKPQVSRAGVSGAGVSEEREVRSKGVQGIKIDQPMNQRFLSVVQERFFRVEIMVVSEWGAATPSGVDRLASWPIDSKHRL